MSTPAKLAEAWELRVAKIKKANEFLSTLDMRSGAQYLSLIKAKAFAMQDLAQADIAWADAVIAVYGNSVMMEVMEDGSCEIQIPSLKFPSFK